MSDYITITKAAAQLDCDVITIRRWISQGKLRGYRVGGKMIRIRQDDLDQFIRPIPTVGQL